jgi:hypothetical protein
VAPAGIEKVQLPRDRSSSDMDTAMEDAAAAKAIDSGAGSRSSDSDSPRRGVVPSLQVEAVRNILGADAEKQVRAASSTSVCGRLILSRTLSRGSWLSGYCLQGYEAPGYQAMSAGIRGLSLSCGTTTQKLVIPMTQKVVTPLPV